MKESDFQTEIRKHALRFGWDYYHPYDSRKGAVGWPDTTLIKDQMAIFAELKTGQRQPTLEQVAWLEALATVKRTECFVWRPEDMDEIIELLASPKA